MTFDYHASRGEGSQALRAGLLDCAGRILAEGGPAALSLRELTRRSNCSTKVIYTLFGGKEGLTEALYLEGFEILRRSVLQERRRADTPLQALEAACLAYRQMALRHPHFFAVMFGGHLREFEPSEEARARALGPLEVLADIVREARGGAGDPAAGDEDARDTAVRLWAAVHGPVSLELQGLHPFDTDGERIARAQIRGVLRELGLVEHRSVR